MGAALTVKTLLGHKNLQFSIECLNSFLKNSKDKIFLQIFEDGTLTEDDASLLSAQLNDVVIVAKKERDSKLKGLLYRYPLCDQYRNNIPYAQKIFDVMLYDSADLLFIDSDIFFLRSFELPSFGQFPVFISDSEHAYSFTPMEFFKIKLPIYPRVNSGFFYFPKTLFSLDFIEELLKDEIINRGLKRRNPWLEQAVWSFLAANAKKVSFFNRRQIVMAEKKLKVDERTIAVHLVSTYRSHFSELQNKTSCSSALDEFSVVELEKEVKFLSKFEFAVERLMKRTKRELGIT